jgi:mannan endo-1,4-beta-mannosidase
MAAFHLRLFVAGALSLACSSNLAGAPPDGASGKNGNPENTDGSRNETPRKPDDGALTVPDDTLDTAPASGPPRIMLLGDSLTASSCYPQLLAKALTDSGHSRFEFVGTVTNNYDCGVGVPSVQSEGHGGYLITNLLGRGPQAIEFSTWCERDRADVVLLLMGSNDVWTGTMTPTIIDAISGVVDALRAMNPFVTTLVAQIPPLAPGDCSTCETGVEDLNAEIPPWAARKSLPLSPVYVVDLWSALPPESYRPNSIYTVDGVHPTLRGAQVIADAWHAALVAHAIP